MIVHAEDENIIRENKAEVLSRRKIRRYRSSVHSLIRGPSAARGATLKQFCIWQKSKMRAFILRNSNGSRSWGRELKKFASPLVTARLYSSPFIFNSIRVRRSWKFRKS